MRLIWCPRLITLAVAAGGLTGRAIERAQVAQGAQGRMVGLTKEQVLSCMGVPASKAAEGATEVWSYSSGNDHTQTATFGPEHDERRTLRQSAIRDRHLEPTIL